MFSYNKFLYFITLPIKICFDKILLGKTAIKKKVQNSLNDLTIKTT